MKSRTLMALAVAGTFACGGAFAGPFHHGSQQSSVQGSSAEAITPASVNESAPWLANLPHSAGWSGTGTTQSIVGTADSFGSNEAIGASADMSGSGYGGFDSLSMASPGYDASIYGLDYSLGDAGGVEYWLLGDESTFGTGVTSSSAGSGSVGFDSSSGLSGDQSFDQSSLGSDEIGVTDYYVVSGPLAQFDPSTSALYEAGPDDLAYLTSPAEGVWVIMPDYDSMAAFDSSDSSSDQLSQYAPFGSDEDLAT